MKAEAILQLMEKRENFLHDELMRSKQQTEKLQTEWFAVARIVSEIREAVKADKETKSALTQEEIQEMAKNQYYGLLDEDHPEYPIGEDDEEVFTHGFIYGYAQARDDYEEDTK